MKSAPDSSERKLCRHAGYIQLFITGTLNGAVISTDYYVQATRWRRKQVSGPAVDNAHAHAATEHYACLTGVGPNRVVDAQRSC